MKLYGSYTSPYVRHCRVALAQLGIEHEFIVSSPEMTAENSPTRRVPYLMDNDLLLTDSSTILKYLREKSGGVFLADLADYDRFILSNTLLDAMLNIALIQKDGIGAEQIPYLQRQKARVESGLKALNDRIDPAEGIKTDSALRCACFLSWALFRKHFSLDGLSNLQGFMANVDQIVVFADTAPFE